MLVICEDFGVPVIDLSRTFDPTDPTHYGTTDIEPSNKSGQFIADLVQFALEKFPFDAEQRTSRIYYGFRGRGAGIVEQENNKNGQESYSQEILGRVKGDE